MDFNALFKHMANRLDSLLIEVDDKEKRALIPNPYMYALNSLADYLSSTEDDFSKKFAVSLKEFPYVYHKHRDVLVKYYKEIREDVHSLLDLASELYKDVISADSIFLMPIDIYRPGVSVNDRETEVIKAHIDEVFGRESLMVYAPVSNKYADDPRPKDFGSAEYCQLGSGMILPVFLAKIIKIPFRPYSMKDKMMALSLVETEESITDKDLESMEPFRLDEE